VDFLKGLVKIQLLEKRPQVLNCNCSTVPPIDYILNFRIEVLFNLVTSNSDKDFYSQSYVESIHNAFQIPILVCNVFRYLHSQGRNPGVVN